MKYVHEIKKALKEVYESKNYLLLTSVLAFIIFSFNILITNSKLIFSNFSFQLISSLLIGSFTSISNISLIFLILISILAGIVLSMSIFLVRRQVFSTVSIGSSSIFVSVLTPSCPSCAIGLLSILGLGSFVAVLPFKGLELGFLGVILLTITLIFLSVKINTKT